MSKVAVIGGGAAGLSAARCLLMHGMEVTVFEQSQALGGRARSDVLEGCIVDVGAQLFGSGFSSLREFAEFAYDGASPLVTSPGRDAVWRGGRVHPITYGNVASMVTSTALPATLKLKLAARYVPFLLRHSEQLNASDPLRNGGDVLDGESVFEWGMRELGRDFVELLAYPLLGAYYGSTPEATSVVLYHALAKAGLDVRVMAIQGGTGALFERAGMALTTRGVRIELGSEVESVRIDGQRVVVDGEAFDGALLAVPPRVAMAMFELDRVTLDWISGVRYAPSAVLALVLSERVRAGYFGVSIPRTENANDLVAICVQQQKTEGLVPNDRSLLICLGAPSVNAELLADPQAGVERMINAAEAVMPGTRARVTHAKLYRHPDGYPVFYPGYLKHLRDFPVAAQTHNVMLAGDYLVAPTVEGAIRSGYTTARRMIDQLRAAG